MSAFLCIWDLKGVFYYEFFKPNEIINTERYCHQLNDLIKKIGEEYLHYI